MSEKYLIEPVGYVRSARATPEDDGWDGVPARIELTTGFGPDALDGLESFSHVEILFVFHAAQDPIETGARHPRGNIAWPRVGIFAQRSKDRPNHIGATICRVVAIHGTTIEVAGLDAIDGSPVIDIKPVWKRFLPRGEMIEPAWSGELMKDYW